MNSKKYSLSNKDIAYFMPNVPLLTYEELTRYDNIDDVLGSQDAAIILIEMQHGHGHWTMILKRNNMLEWFDSYGIYPDNELKYIDMDFRLDSNQVAPYLSKLMYLSKYKLSYNHYKFQQMKQDINTCGRHCIVRYKFRDLPLKKYHDLITQFKSINMNPDDVVTYLTSETEAKLQS